MTARTAASVDHEMRRYRTELWAAAPVETLVVMAYLGAPVEVDGDGLAILRGEAR